LIAINEKVHEDKNFDWPCPVGTILLFHSISLFGAWLAFRLILYQFWPDDAREHWGASLLHSWLHANDWGTGIIITVLIFKGGLCDSIFVCIDAIS
jgi:hypothetical protein